MSHLDIKTQITVRKGHRFMIGLQDALVSDKEWGIVYIRGILGWKEM